MNEKINYFTLAENDWMYCKEAYEKGHVANCLAAMGQNICEKYLKHVISEYEDPETEYDSFKKTSVLKTHNLDVLLRYMDEKMNIQLPEQTENAIHKINGFYFTTRYPGEDAFWVSEKDMNKCLLAVNLCREAVIEITQSFEKEKQLSNFERVMNGEDISIRKESSVQKDSQNITQDVFEH